MAFLMDQHWESQLDIPMMKHWDFMKAPQSTLLMVKCLALKFEHKMGSHLGLMKEPIWVIWMAPLMVLMKANMVFFSWSLT